MNLTNFYPGALSKGGFLGKDEDLDTIIQTDADTLQRIGTTHDEVSNTLYALLGYMHEGYVEDIPNRFRHFTLKLERWRGWQWCPFTGCIFNATAVCPYSDVDFIIKNNQSGERVAGPGMIWHLIGTHHFFEGKGSSYRVDPEQLARVLELETIKA